MNSENTPTLPGFADSEPKTPKTNEAPAKSRNGKSTKEQKVTICISCTADFRKKVKIAAVTREQTLSEFIIVAIKNRMKQ